MAPIPKEISLLIAIGGVFGGFSYMAVKQEILYKTTFGGEGGEKFAFTFLALAAERGINALIALLGVMAFGGSGKKIPHMDIFNSGVSQMFAMAAVRAPGLDALATSRRPSSSALWLVSS